jgi:2'-5' RNA ligase
MTTHNEGSAAAAAAAEDDNLGNRAAHPSDDDATTTSSPVEEGDAVSSLLGSLQKVHHVTVCMVPPPEDTAVWKTVGDMRRQLRDPGYYRWPPHANLLYPFLEVNDNDDKDDDEATNNTTTLLSTILDRLRSAAQQVEPFTVQLNRLGTFGGKRRGVLWLSPDSYVSRPEEDTNSTSTTSGDTTSTNSSTLSPLVQLQQLLEEAFPMCQDQSSKGGSAFTPHMTLSHFETLDDALRAQQEIERDYFASSSSSSLEFRLDRIYLLSRQGDGGQFLRVADIGLGKEGVVQQWLPSPIPFPAMPTQEDDWVHQERMKLKARRNGGGRNQRRGGSNKRSTPRRRAEPRIPDTPEVIAAKRAERKAKRERLALEQEPEKTQ